MVLAGEDAGDQLALGGEAEELGQRPDRRVALQSFDRAGGEDQHAVLRLAAEHLLPGEGDHIELVEGKRLGEGGAGGVADGEAAALHRYPVAVGDAHAGGGAVPGEHHVAGKINLGEVGELAVAGLDHMHVVEAQLLDHVGHPAGAEALPCQNVDAARAQHRPQRHLHGAGVRGGNDADAVVVGDLQDIAGLVYGLLQACLRRFRPVGATEHGVSENLGGPSGALGGGAGGKTRICRRARRPG